MPGSFSACLGFNISPDFRISHWNQENQLMEDMQAYHTATPSLVVKDSCKEWEKLFKSWTTASPISYQPVEKAFPKIRLLLLFRCQQFSQWCHILSEIGVFIAMREVFVLGEIEEPIFRMVSYLIFELSCSIYLVVVKICFSSFFYLFLDLGICWTLMHMGP